MNLLEILKLSTEYLKKKNIESPRLNSELMLCKILNYDRVKLYMNFDRPLNQDEIAIQRDFIRRRGENEPLQYILEEEKFYGLKFKLNKNVLIPRPETELLVEYAISKIQNEVVNILEIGTGSGNIAISLAKNLINSKIVSIDNNEKAIALAKINAEQNNVLNVEFRNCDIFDNDLKLENFNYIISNPPYILLSEKVKLQPEVSFYEPSNALFVENEMKYFSKIIELGNKLLPKNGKIFFECGKGQSSRIKELFNKNSYDNIEIVKDLSNIERVIIGEKYL